jgi:hypothetical protein
MWHFGKDALTSYSYEKFDISWEDSLNVFHHIYSKEYGEKKMKVRKEVQEYPSKSLKEALMDKIKKMMMVMVIKHSQSDFNKQL